MYAVKEANGDLELLVINKSASGPITGDFSLAGLQPDSQAQVWQYGEAQDTAQSQSPTGQAALANFTAKLPLSGSTFNYDFPAYSMSVVELSPTTSATGPTITSQAAATSNLVAGTSVGLSVSASDPGGDSSLTYTWSTMPSSPAGVVFSVNGTNAAAQTTATFSRAGAYVFQVTVADPGGLTATSDVTVNVVQTLSSIKVSPSVVTVAAGATQSFTAQVDDQFGNEDLLPLPFTWSLASGIGSIDALAGVYTAPEEAGSAVVKATFAGISGTASVTVTPPNQGGGLSATVHYTDSNDWRKGFVGDVMITNTGASAINGWTMQFNFAPKITTIWGASILERSGTQYMIESATYDAVIAPGQSVSFGFKGKPGRAQAGPGDIILDGVSLPLSPNEGSPTATAVFTVTGHSRSRTEAMVTITNMGTIPIGGWALQFHFTPRITAVSGAAIARHAGPVYVIRDAGYDGVIAPGSSASFQFKISQRSLRSRPSRLLLDGVPISVS